MTTYGNGWIIIFIGILLCVMGVLVYIALDPPDTTLTYNQRFVDGVPVINCKYNQNIQDLSDPCGQERLLGHTSHGYCPESNYDIATSNDIAELYQRISYLEKEIKRLKENKQ